LISSFVIVYLLSCINFNRISHHFFYRDRLAEAFLMTFARYSNVHGERVILSARNAVDMPLASLHGNDEHHVCDCAARGPYHLINATLNLTGSHDLSGFRRQSEVFLFSRCFTGSDRTGYIRTKEYGNNLKVARAMTVSGAAVTSVMGAMGSLAASFVCTILGVRLGFWLQNPRELAKNKKRFRWVWLSALLAELLRYTHARGKYIYLSDGGHSGDNLGILSLLRRRAKLIIASDAECDLSYSFNSLNSSLRRAYVDYGIKVDLEISKDNLELDEDRRTKTHFVLGRILYPDRPWQPSWLLVIKNSITGDELAPILNYKKKSPAFPHETTADQFFSEEQFESYRALGRHAAESTFTMNKPLFKSPKMDPWSHVDELCRRLERYKKHQWDDVIQAMWDTEQGDFSSWTTFREMVSGNVSKMPKGNAANKDLLKINNWLKDHKELFTKLEKKKNVPRNVRQFKDVQLWARGKMCVD
jgi:hypothetical protein